VQVPIVLNKLDENLKNKVKRKMKTKQKTKKAPIKASKPGLFEWLAGTTR
jgi:hypothetical protein